MFLFFIFIEQSERDRERERAERKLAAEGAQAVERRQSR